MEKIFYTEANAFPSSTQAIEYILKTYFDIPNARIVKSENGKPYLENPKYRLFFSVSHTKNKLFIAFSDENIGLDAEVLSREVDLPLLLRRFPVEERKEIQSTSDFLRHWTARESAIKWLGGTLASDLKKLSFIKDRLCYDGIDIPVPLVFLEIEGHILALCGERDFTRAEQTIL